MLEILDTDVMVDLGRHVSQSLLTTAVVSL